MSKHLKERALLSVNTVAQFESEIMLYIKHEASKTHEGERLLGSSEIIESAFGKQKFIEKEQSKSGFTGLLLALPALLSKTTEDIVNMAMRATPVDKIKGWYTDNIKSSVQSDRKNAFRFIDKEEQKLDQIMI